MNKNKSLEPVRLPTFELGKGVRLETCRHYAGCLDRFARIPQVAGRPEDNAQCPTSCRHYVEVDRRARLDREASARTGVGPTISHQFERP